MTNPYGITLDREWSEWAANIAVSPTVAAALLLICQARPLDEIVARLTPRELEQVVEIVGRCPDHFPPGTLDALKSRSLAPTSQRPSVSTFERSSAQSAARAHQPKKSACACPHAQIRAPEERRQARHQAKYPCPDQPARS